MTAKAVTAVLPRGEAIKNFVYSGALDDIARSRPVDVISVLPNHRSEELLRSRYRNVSALIDEEPPRLVRIERELFDLSHTRWLWSEAAKNHRTLIDNAARKSLGRRVRWAARKALAGAFANPVGLSLLDRIDRAVGRRLASTRSWQRELDRSAPGLVFNASHIHSAVALPVIHAAHSLGIPTAAFLFSWDNLTSQGRMMPTYDHYLVWNDAIKMDLMRIYPRTREQDVTVTGTPQFDFHYRPEVARSREEFCAEVGADPSRPIVLYTTSMPYHTPEEPRIVEAVAAALREVRGVARPQLLVRVYAKDTTGRFDALAARALPDVLFQRVDWDPNWLTPTYEDCILWSNTLRHVDFGINVASTVSLELCMFGKPAINIAYDPPGVDIRPVSYARYYSFDHYRPVTESGAIDVVRRSEDLLPALQDAFDAPARREAQRERLLHRMFGNTLDGRSANRVASALDGIAA